MTIQQTVKTATMDTKELHETLQKVNRIKQRRDLPIYSNAYAEFANGKATLTTTDLERVIRIRIDSTNSESFSTLLPRKLIEKFLHGANGKVSITQDKPAQVTLSRNGIGDLKLTVPKAGDFPLSPMPDNLEWHSLDGKWFCSMLRIVSAYCDTEAVGKRLILKGIACNDGAIAAADGFRLALLRDSRLAFGLGDKQAIIPLDTISLILKLFRKEETLGIAFETIKETNLGVEREVSKRIYLKSSNVTLASEVIQGTYPDYEQLVPKSFNFKVSFSAPLMFQRLSMIDAEAIGSNIVRYTFGTSEHGEQICSLTSHSEDECDYHLSCPVKFNREGAKIAFAHRYILEAIKPFSLCNLEITSPASPGKITGDIEGLSVIIQPMFVQW